MIDSLPATINSMKFRVLGNTGLLVSEIGFGAWGIGGNNEGALAYGPTEDGESIDAVRRAFDLGVNFYDTSDLYGYGHSEKLLGRALRKVRSEVIIASKSGFIRGASGQDFTPLAVKRSIEASLQRLGTDYIDLYQLHSPPIDVLSSEMGLIPMLKDCVREGKIRAYGISVRTPEDAYHVVDGYGFSAIQMNFNLVDQRALRGDLFDMCSKRGIGIVVRTPLCYGFLTGCYDAELVFDETDHRSRWSAEQLRVWADAYRLFIEGVYAQEDQTPAQFALRFCLSHPSVSTAIPGMLNRDHVEENAKAPALGLLNSCDLDRIRQVYHDHCFFIEPE